MAKELMYQGEALETEQEQVGEMESRMLFPAILLLAVIMAAIIGAMIYRSSGSEPTTFEEAYRQALEKKYGGGSMTTPMPAQGHVLRFGEEIIVGKIRQ